MWISHDLNVLLELSDKGLPGGHCKHAARESHPTWPRLARASVDGQQ